MFGKRSDYDSRRGGAGRRERERVQLLPMGMECVCTLKCVMRNARCVMSQRKNNESQLPEKQLGAAERTVSPLGSQSSEIPTQYDASP